MRRSYTTLEFGPYRQLAMHLPQQGIEEYSNRTVRGINICPDRAAQPKDLEWIAGHRQGRRATDLEHSVANIYADTVHHAHSISLICECQDLDQYVTTTRFYVKFLY
jgi:hypothetical protein